jgi:hypothetical protein
MDTPGSKTRDCSSSSRELRVVQVRLLSLLLVDVLLLLAVLVARPMLLTN